MVLVVVLVVDAFAWDAPADQTIFSFLVLVEEILGNILLALGAVLSFVLFHTYKVRRCRCGLSTEM